jgi:hypothetical protein
MLDGGVVQVSPLEFLAKKLGDLGVGDMPDDWKSQITGGF